MALFLIRLALIAVAGGMTTLGFATLSADGESLTIHIGPLAAWLNDWALGAGLTAAGAWVAMWRSAKAKGGMT